MQAYSEFAKVYDRFMSDAPYEKWRAFIIKRLRQYGIHDGLLLDLGCGTGTLTRMLAQQGYDMIGADDSVEMLEVAKRLGEKCPDTQQILYIAQDMRELELYGTVRAVISSCDCINYILNEEELRRVFALVNNYLDPEGVFLFDFNTTYKYKEIIGNTVIAENQEDASFIWENYYDPEEKINEYDVTFFLKQENGLYKKSVEEHFQKAYDLPTIKSVLEQAGLEFVEAFDDYADLPTRKNSERICVLAKERGKRGK